MAKQQLTSPWLEQLQRARPMRRLTESVRTNICVVGGGIAGASSAYFILKNTDKRVTLVEAERVAHGATGHNAGQLVSYFEKPFHEIVHEFGLTMAAEGQMAVNSVWHLLDEIRADLDIETPCDIFTGYAGFLDRATIVDRLKSNEQKKRAKIPFGMMYVAREFATQLHIPHKFRGLYEFVPHDDILDLLQSRDIRYKAAFASKKGCMNSARFTEEVMTKLLERYGGRFEVFEQSPIVQITLHRKRALLKTRSHTITADRAVLCTNGFERIHIVNTHGGNIETKFHHLVRGSVGYMAAFIEPEQGAPTAISYFPSQKINKDAFASDPYVYMTRRRHTFGKAASTRRQSLICIGGPEALMDDTNNYSREHPYPAEAAKSLRTFLRHTYKNKGRLPQYQYLWHGLMGYTPNGLRCIGSEPCNPVLLYNLGCNGVGLLPSVYGGLRISQIIRGDILAPSIFDPQDNRCTPYSVEDETAKTTEPIRAALSISFLIFAGVAITLLLLLFL